MGSGNLIVVIFLATLLFSGLCQILRSVKQVLSFLWIGVIIICIPVIFIVWEVLTMGPLFACGQRLYVDVFSVYHLAILMIIFLMSSLYANYYFQEETASGMFSIKVSRRFGSLWFISLAAMMLVLISNDLGIMWVGMETTTLVTAFLICPYRKKKALEAMWKYLIVCSVGIAFAFMGTIIVAASAHKLFTSSTDMFLWTNLRHFGYLLNPELIKMGFLFIVVGYGTKAGLAPMHTWLPDAHSQAPTPVSAIFSGFMLNTALYCILRYVPLVDTALGSTTFTHGLLIFFGVSSVLIAAVFIPFQHDLKRMLAYSSVEHIGIIALGFGLGPLGTIAALFHMFNHSICKTLTFFCAGSIGKLYKTFDMKSISGAVHVSRFWGVSLFACVLALIGVVPFALFMSELLIVRAAISSGAWIPLGLFLSGITIVFAGILYHVINLLWGNAQGQLQTLHRISFIEKGMLILFLGVLIILGLWMPISFRSVLESAAQLMN